MENFITDIQNLLLSTGLPPELQVLVLAAMPLTELRAAIPLGLTFFDLPAEVVFVMGVIGNMIPVLIIANILNPVCTFLSNHSQFFEKFFQTLFEKTRNKHSKKIEKYGIIFLTIFVAIPLPGSGAWTGALIGFIFGFPKRKSLLAILLGLIIAGIIVTIGAESILKLFLARPA